MPDAMWWELVDRVELVIAVRALLLAGGCLVLEGDWESGRSQAASIAERELTADGYSVRRITCGGTASTSFAALVEAWSQLGEVPADSYSLTPQTVVAGRSVPSLVVELARMLRNAVSPTALIFEDLDRDGDREYNYHPVFSRLASASQRPVVVTYDGTTGAWSNAGGVLELRDFTPEEVLQCLEEWPAASIKSEEELDSAVDFVFGSLAGRLETVRPRTAYTRLQAWGERAG